MADEDVKYRLSAEGLADVVGAFRKVASEAKSSGAQAEKGFGGFGKGLQGITGLLQGVAAAVAAVGLARLVVDASNVGEQLDNLHKRFQLNFEDLSALRVLVERTGGSFQELAPALTKFVSDTAAASRDLGGEAADNFRRLGLSTKEIANFAKQDLGRRLETVGRALVKLPEGPQRADAAIAALGNRSAKLIPILEAVGEQGFANLRREADRVANLFDEEMVGSLARLNDVFDDTKKVVQGLAAEFSQGLQRPLTGAAEILIKTAVDGKDAWRQLGEAVGNVIAAYVFALDELWDKWATFWTNVGAVTNLAARGIGAALRGEAREAAIFFDLIRIRIEREASALEDRHFARIVRFQQASESAARPKGPDADAAAAAAAAAEASARARAAAAKAGIDADLSLQKATNKLLEDEASRTLDLTKEGLKTRREEDARYYWWALEATRTYFARRRELSMAGIDAELTALRAQRKIAAGEGEKGLADIAKIDGKIKELAIARVSQLASINADEDKQLREISDKALDARFESAERSLTDLGRERARIEDAAQAGLISQVAAQLRIKDLEMERVERLRAIADELIRAAEGTGDQARIQAALDFSFAVDRITLSLEAQNQELRKLGTEGIAIAQQELEHFLGQGIREAPTFEAALVGALKAVGVAVQDLLAKFIALKIVGGLVGLFSKSPGGTGVFEGVPGGPSSPARGFARGGRVPGAGGRDSRWIRVTPGEFVIRPEVVGANIGLLEAINAGSGIAPLASPPGHYAGGGLVDSTLSGPTGVNFAADLGLEPGLVVKHLESSEGERAIIRVISRNRRAVGRAIGGA